MDFSKSDIRYSSSRRFYFSVEFILKLGGKGIYIDMFKAGIIDTTEDMVSPGHPGVVELDVFSFQRTAFHLEIFLFRLCVEMSGITKKFSEDVSHGLGCRVSPDKLQLSIFTKSLIPIS